PGRETLVSWPQLEKTIFRINQGGQAENPIKTPTPEFNLAGNGKYKKGLSAVYDVNGGKFDSSEDGPTGDLGHGTTHEINSNMRKKVNAELRAYVMRNGQRVLDNQGGATLGGYNAFLSLYKDKDGTVQARTIALKEPEFDFGDIRAYVPSQMTGTSSYGTYINGERSLSDWQYHPLYVFDELTSYSNGAIVSSEENRRKSTSVVDFMSYSVALGQAVQQRDPTYWSNENGEKFRSFLGYSLERALDAESRQYGGNLQYAREKFNSYIDENGRNFLRKTYGAAWTKSTFGF
ncbi:MAG: hypothetical protein WC402_05295, partial [Candidatus Pacearchaeota archaeon]